MSRNIYRPKDYSFFFKFGFLQLESIMDTNLDKFIEQSIDVLADVYNEVDGDEKN